MKRLSDFDKYFICEERYLKIYINQKYSKVSGENPEIDDIVFASIIRDFKLNIIEKYFCDNNCTVKIEKEGKKLFLLIRPKEKKFMGSKKKAPYIKWVFAPGETSRKKH